MRILQNLLIGLSLFASIGWSQDEAEDASLPPSEDSGLHNDVAISQGDGQQTPPQIKQKSAPSRVALRNAIQRELNKSGQDVISTSSMERLELTRDQQRELQQWIDSRQNRFQKMIDDLQTAANSAKNSEEFESIASTGHRKLGELKDDLMNEFRKCLLPHQIDALESNLTQTHLQRALHVCREFDVSFFNICSSQLDLSTKDERKFEDRATAAIKRFEKRVEDAKKELRNELQQSVREGKRDGLDKMFGEDPSWILDQLKLLAAR